MGKRWAGGGGRRPTLDLGGAALRADPATTAAAATNASAQVAGAVAADAVPPPAASMAPAGTGSALLGLMAEYDDDDVDEGNATAVAPGSLDASQHASAAAQQPSHVEQPGAGEWQSILDPNTNEYYYWNTVTNEVRWVWPCEQAAAAAVTPVPEAPMAAREAVQAAPVATSTAAAAPVPVAAAPVPVEAPEGEAAPDAPSKAAQAGEAADGGLRTAAAVSAAATLSGAAVAAASCPAATTREGGTAAGDVASQANVAAWRWKRAVHSRTKAESAVATATEALAVATTDEEIAAASSTLAAAEAAVAATAAAEVEAEAEANVATAAAAAAAATAVGAAKEAAPPSAAHRARTDAADDLPPGVLPEAGESAAVEGAAALPAVRAASDGVGEGMGAGEAGGVASEVPPSATIQAEASELESRLRALVALWRSGELGGGDLEEDEMPPAELNPAELRVVTDGGAASLDGGGGPATAVETVAPNAAPRLWQQLRARRTDWAAGALEGGYFWRVLCALRADVHHLEGRGLHSGWTRAWHTESAKHYFAHPATGESRWDEPPPPEPTEPPEPIEPPAAMTDATHVSDEEWARQASARAAMHPERRAALAAR